MNEGTVCRSDCKDRSGDGGRQCPRLGPRISSAVARFPQNAVTKRRYTGINVPLLWFMAQARGFSEHAWLTYQASPRPRRPSSQRRKGTPVLFTKPLQVKDKKTEEDKTVRLLRLFWVFNISQIEGLTLVEQDKQPLPVHERNARVEAFLKATGAEIRTAATARTTTRPTTMCSSPSWARSLAPTSTTASRSTNSGTGREQAPGSTASPPVLSCAPSMRSRSWSQNSPRRIYALTTR